MWDVGFDWFGTETANLLLYGESGVSTTVAVCHGECAPRSLCRSLKSVACPLWRRKMLTLLESTGVHTGQIPVKHHENQWFWSPFARIIEKVTSICSDGERCSLQGGCMMSNSPLKWSEEGLRRWYQTSAQVYISTFVLVWCNLMSKFRFQYALFVLMPLPTSLNESRDFLKNGNKDCKWCQMLFLFTWKMSVQK